MMANGRRHVWSAQFCFLVTGKLDRSELAILLTFVFDGPDLLLNESGVHLSCWGTR